MPVVCDKKKSREQLSEGEQQFASPLHCYERNTGSSIFIRMRSTETILEWKIGAITNLTTL
jgi:hypothetical protein